MHPYQRIAQQMEEKRLQQKQDEAAPSPAHGNARKPGYLPLEILHKICAILADDKTHMFADLMSVNSKLVCRSTAYEQRYHHQKRAIGSDLASCAAVNRHWQAAFEPTTFRHIMLGPRDMPMFEVCFASRARRLLLRWIHLRVEVLGYDESHSNGDTCEYTDNRKERDRHNAALAGATLRLFSCLAPWRLYDTHLGEGITLEMSVVDKRQTYLEFPEQEHFRTWDRLDSVDGWIRTYEAENLAKPSWRQSPNAHWANTISYDRWALELDDRRGLIKRPPLPPLDCVRQFVVARDSAYPLSPLYTLLPLLVALPRLETVRFEPWLSALSGSYAQTLEGSACLLNVLPNRPSIKVLSVFQNFYMAGTLAIPSPPPSELTAVALVKAAAANLEELHVAFTVEALDFFRTTVGPLAEPAQDDDDDDDGDNSNLLKSSSKVLRELVAGVNKAASAFEQAQRASSAEGPFAWPNLRLLTLTSHRFVRGDASDTLVLAAAEAARYMPRLERMEVFGNEPEDNRIFRYECPTRRLGRRPAHITQYTMWRDDAKTLSGPLLAAWRETVEMHHGAPAHIRAKRIVMQPRNLIGNMAIIKYLKHKEHLFAGHPSLAGVLEDASWTNIGRPHGTQYEARREERKKRREKAKTKAIEAGGL